MALATARIVAPGGRGCTGWSLRRTCFVGSGGETEPHAILGAPARGAPAAPGLAAPGVLLPRRSGGRVGRRDGGLAPRACGRGPLRGRAHRAVRRERLL